MTLTGPTELIGPKDSSGNIVGCKSACAAGLGDPSTSSLHSALPRIPLTAVYSEQPELLHGYLQQPQHLQGVRGGILLLLQ